MEVGLVFELSVSREAVRTLLLLPVPCAVLSVRSPQPLIGPMSAL